MAVGAVAQQQEQNGGATPPRKLADAIELLPRRVAPPRASIATRNSRRMSPNETDGLADACRRGEESAFAELFRQHSRAVQHAAYRVLGDEAEADDVLQETFLTAFRRIRTYRGEGTMRGWLVQIGVRLALRFRRRRSSGPTLDPDGVVEPPAPSTPREDREFTDALEREVQALPERSRLVFVLHTSEGLTHAEIGHALGIDEGTSKSQLSYARSLLRRRLGRFRHGPV